MPLKPHPVIPRELDGSQANLPAGDYDVELVIPDIEEKLNGPDGKKLRAHFQVLPADTGEMLDLGTNWLLMEDIAAKTGGKVFPASQAAELVDAAAEPQRHARVRGRAEDVAVVVDADPVRPAAVVRVGGKEAVGATLNQEYLAGWVIPV